MKKRKIKLPDSLTPRDYQSEAKDTAISLIESNPEQWHLFSSPTGTGKSIIEILLLQAIESSILVTPRIEIIAGILEKMGHWVEDSSNAEIISLASDYGLYTPIRLRNILAKGELPFHPDLCIVDECHHDLADSYQDITMYLNGTPKVGLTATPYRGTPKGTAAFYEQWGDTINQIMTLKAAIEDGYCTLPLTTLWPMVDDDIIEVTNGEISSKAADIVISDRIEALVDRVKAFYCKKSRLWDKPTMFALPTTNLVKQLVTALNQRGLPAVAVTQDTKRSSRASAFQNVINCSQVLVQIDVISEGVDLPLRRLIDCRPTLSPVKWVQQLGRIMRPVNRKLVFLQSGQVEKQIDLSDFPEYICCCRNLERHCYLMEGLIPNSTIKEAQEIFGKPSKRTGIRAIGLEGLGRFVNTPVDLMNGLTVTTYNLVHVDQFKRTEYFVLVHPSNSEPVRARREISRNEDGSFNWKGSKWSLIESIPDLKGFQSATPYPLTDNQRKRWNQWAEPLGLNPHREVNARNIQVLFFLRETGFKL